MESILQQSFIDSLQELSQIALSPSCKKNPSAFFYKNAARNILFRLEGLARICRKVYDKKQFNNLYQTFKTLEDGLGSIDYYDAFSKEFKDSKLPKSFTNYFDKNIVTESNKLNSLIREMAVCSEEFFNTINEHLTKTKWLDATDERKKIIKFLMRQIEKIEEDFNSGKLNFTDVETGIHETRRRVRWISIYASVLNGLVQLKHRTTADSTLKVYLTKEVVSSPYNKFPKVPKGIKPVYIYADHFYALSWLINELGKIKDNALKHEAANNALTASRLKNTVTIRQTVLKNTLAPKNACEQAELILEEFIFDKKVFEKLKRDLALA